MHFQATYKPVKKVIEKKAPEQQRLTVAENVDKDATDMDEEEDYAEDVLDAAKGDAWQGGR